MNSSSSNSNWSPGKSYVAEFEGKQVRCFAGDDNYLLKLSEEALKILDRQLSARQSWHLGWAIDIAKTVRSAKKDKWSRVFMTEAINSSTL